MSLPLLLTPTSCDNQENIQTEQPNIILILADYMGFSDLGCFGSEIQTSHLDKLAENGVRLTAFFNSG